MGVSTDESGNDLNDLLLLTAGKPRHIFKNLMDLAGGLGLSGANTVWTYNADDTVNTVADARGAMTTYGYAGTNRHLVKTITHTLSGSPTINVSYNYDAVGNRTSMTDGLGSVTYARNQLSQLTSETRTFTGVGSFTVNYVYNLAGQLTSVTDPFGAQIGYAPWGMTRSAISPSAKCATGIATT